ncbi:xylulokinase [Streptomyces sp. DvalAA-14]|uniref:xylulokinase n=1 Tax=unclassified Streptomyces TaxID=2593676 RepID=UPI00081B3F16|nr:MULTISPECIES: xylulokinase [unclassified Streptomyces]MYS23258.1 xylulokinase [Streptomyces sp. SID4948]SCE30292.1 xylulokinase [Streptomyces sp. DvalAA-14]
MASQDQARGRGQVVLGVDSSTQSTKVLAVDVDSGEVLARGQAPHTVSGGAGRESDPEEWWRALLDALGQLGPYAGQAAAVSVGGQQHGLVVLDAAGRPLRPALLWNDVRSAPQAAALVERYGAQWWAERFGSVPGASFTVTKWEWLRANEPQVAAAAAGVRLPHDFLTERLSGVAVTDRGDASGTGWWASQTGEYDETLLGEVGLDPKLLPAVLAPGRQAGTVRERLPLRAGALVAAGTGDNAAAALGLGLTPGRAVLSLGTSGTVYAVSRQRPADPSGTVAGFAAADGGWLPLACTLNCTLAVDKVAALLGRDREQVEPGGSVAFLPFLDGERTPNLPYASGLLTGLRHETTAGQVLQGAYDGAVWALLRALDEVLAVDGTQSAEPLLLIGGGARGTAWRETVLRLSGRPVQIPAAGELVALGAAVQAAALLTGESPTTVAARWATSDGPRYDAVPRDEEALTRLAAALPLAGA